MAERTFLVTGASGFIGRVLVQTLKPLGRVRALLRHPGPGPWDESARADLARGDSLGEAMRGVDTVFHLAGYAHDTATTGEAEDLHRALTVDGTRRVLEACRAAGVQRIVFVSTVKAMGEGGAVALDEASPARPVSAYGRSRHDAEELVLHAGAVPHAAVLRLPLVYGPGGKGNLANMIAAIDAGRFPPVPPVMNARSMVHVEDVARAALLAADNPAAAGCLFIITDGRAYDTRTIYQWMCRETGRPVPRWSVPVWALRLLARAGDMAGQVTGTRARFDSRACEKLLGSSLFDGSRARTVLGFDPAWDLERALPAMVADVRRRGTVGGPPAGRDDGLPIGRGDSNLTGV
jgi:nucleoside-diphosphate-sugar epimerase